MDTKLIINAMRDAGFKVQSYSGRSMYGKRCVAVVCDSNNISDIILDILSESMDFIDHHSYQDDNDSIRDSYNNLIDSLRNAQMDSLGTSYVVYWSGLEWPSDIDEEI